MWSSKGENNRWQNLWQPIEPIQNRMEKKRLFRKEESSIIPSRQYNSAGVRCLYGEIY